MRLVSFAVLWLAMLQYDLIGLLAFGRPTSNSRLEAILKELNVWMDSHEIQDLQLNPNGEIDSRLERIESSLRQELLPSYNERPSVNADETSLSLPGDVYIQTMGRQRQPTWRERRNEVQSARSAATPLFVGVQARRRFTMSYSRFFIADDDQRTAVLRYIQANIRAKAVFKAPSHDRAAFDRLVDSIHIPSRESRGDPGFMYGQQLLELFPSLHVVQSSTQGEKGSATTSTQAIQMTSSFTSRFRLGDYAFKLAKPPMQQDVISGGKTMRLVLILAVPSVPEQAVQPVFVGELLLPNELIRKIQTYERMGLQRAGVSAGISIRLDD